MKQACEARFETQQQCVLLLWMNRQPYQRIVLLKHFDDKGLVFYTNLGSRKAQHLEK